MPTVLPQQKTTLSASCLAIPSMGSMVLRMDGRKGTMPNAVREKLSQGLQAQSTSHPPPLQNFEGAHRGTSHSIRYKTRNPGSPQGPPKLLRDIKGPESQWHLPLDTERLASVCNTEECGRMPGWNLLSTSSITWLMNRFPTATRTLLAACCQSQSSSYIPNNGQVDLSLHLSRDYKQDTTLPLVVPGRGKTTVFQFS